MRKIKYIIFTFFNRLLFYFHPKIQQKIQLTVPYVTSKPGNCGLACVSMILSFNQKTHVYSQLIKKYKNPHFYDSLKGWIHTKLAFLLNKFNLSYKSHKCFFTTNLLAHIAKTKQPVIVSLLSKKNHQFEGHLCVLVGMDKQHFYIHDPRENFNGRSLSLTFTEFNQQYSGNCIYKQ